MPEQHEAKSSADEILPETATEIVKTVTEAVDSEAPGRTEVVKSDTGQILGRVLVIDATEKKKGALFNLCRLSVLNDNMNETGEVVRLEYEHDKDTKYGNQRIYSVQSVRRQGGKFVLLENFLAESPETVREADFKPISSESYAQQTVLSTLRDWTKFRLWQRKQGQN
jgi:hypothetical protein